MSAAKNKHNRPRDLVLGKLPCAKINAALGLELEEGDVVFTAAAQVHAERRHPNEFAKCLPFVGLVVTDPLYVGDDGRNEGKIELIAKVQTLGTAVLAAIVLEPDSDGRYRVASLYPLGLKKVEQRRQARRLVILPLK